MISFTGTLEHFPIVDVMQLLHQTRKSGILRIKGRKGESQLVFKDGYMVSANHLNNSVRIGQILVDLKIITPEILAKALLTQGYAGARRKPLIITLIELGLVNDKDAYQGLEHLIEMAVVEILTWKKGTFALEVLPSVVDDFRFYPGKLLKEISVDTQSVLMDALRIFDEKKRDGELVEEPEDEPAARVTSQLNSATGPAGHHPPPVNAPDLPPQGSRGSHLSGGHDAVDRPAHLLPQQMRSVCPACQYRAFGKESFEVCPQCGEGNHAPLPVSQIGLACSLAGVALLGYGLYGLTAYYGTDWGKVFPEGGAEPLSRMSIFFRFGFLPWLFTLFGGLFFSVARRFQMLRNNALKQMQIAAWAGIGVCGAYEVDKFFAWIRIADAPSSHYYAIGIWDALLMTALFSLPFLALLRYLRSKAVIREFAQ